MIVIIYSDNKDQFIREFFEYEINTWILKLPMVLISFKTLFYALDESSIKILKGKKIFTLTSQGLWASTVNPQKDIYLIIIFPNLLKLLNSKNYLQGVAVLAHELGHILLEHYKGELSPIEEQFEADDFAAKVGFKKELVEFLSLYPNSKECKLRIKILLKGAIRPRLIP
jgi:hypothetical protein